MLARDNSRARARALSPHRPTLDERRWITRFPSISVIVRLKPYHRRHSDELVCCLEQRYPDFAPKRNDRPRSPTEQISSIVNVRKRASCFRATFTADGA